MFTLTHQPHPLSTTHFTRSRFEGLELVNRSRTDLLRELIKFAFGDSLRYAGIPGHWVDCEVKSLFVSDAAPEFQIRFIVRHRDGHLLRHAHALQNDILRRLYRYQPNEHFSSYDWVWTYSKECEVTLASLPSAEEWRKTLTDGRRQRLTPTRRGSVPDRSFYSPHAAIPKSDANPLRSIFSSLTRS